jgi:hypothetical protein
MMGRQWTVVQLVGALLGAAAALAACGADEQSEDDASADVTCTPAPVPDRLTLEVELERGGRIPFTYEVEREDASDEGASFSDSTDGEIAIGAQSDFGREIEWRLPEQGVAFVLAGQSSPEEIESRLGEEAVSGEVAIPLTLQEDGRISKEIDLRALRSMVRETLTPIATQFGEEAFDDASAEQITLLGQVLGIKLVEKPGFMLYPYGLELDPDRVITRSRHSFSPTGGVDLVEEIEVLDQESEGGCVVVEIRDVPEPGELEAQVSEIGEVFGTFDTSEVSDLDVDFRSLIYYDAGEGLIRQIEYVREVADPDRTVRAVDRFEISDPEGATLFEYATSGLYGTTDSVMIRADGSGVVRGRVDPVREREFTLTYAELSELRTILEATPISSLPDPGHAKCDYCNTYTYVYGGDEISLTDASEPTPQLDDLRDFIAELPAVP